jgi:predicted CoA-binding protein
MDHNKEYSAKYLADVLASVKTIAMVGASPDPTKFSYGVLRVLHEQGFEMFPINNKPEIKEIRGIKVFLTLDAIDQPVDMVQVFRKSEALYGVAEEAINIGAKVLWGQIGVFNEDAATLAESAGMQVVMNRCPKIELFRPFWKPKLGLGI